MSIFYFISCYKRLDILFIFAFSILNFGLCYGACGRVEYEIDGKCCPMCAPGNCVYRHCTEDTTTCVPCPDSTVLDAPNGLSLCFNCTVCDPSQGLRVKTPCTRSSDTVFEPLDGHYCLEKKRISCSLAAKHTACLPGQYIKQRGNRVYRHCTEDTSTTCVPCLDSTYLDAPNSLLHCFRCAVCNPGHGLRVMTPCTRSSDTVCEPLDGHYCLEKNRGSCSLATKHTACLPGQYIKQRAFTDTKCGECSDGTYSNGLLHICSTYTKCEDSGLTEIKPGTKVSDVECGRKTSAVIIAGPLFSVVLLLSAAVFIFFKRKVIIKYCTAQGNKLPKQRRNSI
ncbi:tumor necrosis factor receptor superfamily member 5-like isoform X2 [Hoplias malabaricus]|uniref:tumor necrosis factor receptor superfamily member 5-like isoform X2 n=1 Tax=Hoplias malabaricus TaxID=27720 RepID=UPI00346254F1